MSAKRQARVAKPPDKLLEGPHEGAGARDPSVEGADDRNFDARQSPPTPLILTRIGWAFGLGIVGLIAGAIGGCSIVGDAMPMNDEVDTSGRVLYATMILGATAGVCLGFFLVGPFMADLPPEPRRDDDRPA
jgi:hypothetical protein